MKTKHAHEFKTGRSKNVETCSCGRFRNMTSSENAAILAVEHTPLPWKVVETLGEDAIVQNIPWKSPGIAPITVAHVWSHGKNGDPKANAAFIVKAVNAHEELVELVKMFRSDILMSGREPHSNLMKRIEKAIDEAETRHE